MSRRTLWTRLGLATVVGVPFLMGASQAPGGPDGEVAFRFLDPEITESSGLVMDRRYAVTVNDSGDSARAFTVDRSTGRTLSTSTWPGRPDDVEALAPAGKGQVWVGDIGDNTKQRDSIQVVRVPVSAQGGSAGQKPVTLTYPDGPHNAEAMAADPRTGRLVIVTKDSLGGGVYTTSTKPTPGSRQTLTALDGELIGTATDAAFFPDGKHLIVRNYTHAKVYAWPSLETVSTFPLPEQKQGEGIAVDAADRVYVSSEGRGSEVLRVDLPERVQEAIGGSAGAGDASGAGEPSEANGPDQGGESAAAGESAQRPGWRLPRTLDQAVPWALGAGGALAVAAGVMLAGRMRRK